MSDITRNYIDLAPDSEAEAAFKVINSVYEAYRTFKPERIEDVQLPEYSVWDGTLPQLFKSLAEVKYFHHKDQENTKARGAFSFELKPLRIDINGDWALLLCHMYAEWQEPNAASMHMRLTDVMKKVDGKWHMYHHHESEEPSGYKHI
ncbi:MAG: nuclear transport factor 2 family protein [Rhodospirillaceae bacterium]